KVFDLFYTKSADKQSKGTGVGLALVKKIVSLHGGRVWIESEPGKGTVVKFTILKK
ncbi:HAMP domain-containing histidine kinase, partial [candidate division KSB1 bacterium]|nr:HAMP domain-containing histidine kinase [candidate division KSB1 bacterium]